MSTKKLEELRPFATPPMLPMLAHMPLIPFVTPIHLATPFPKGTQSIIPVMPSMAAPLSESEQKLAVLLKEIGESREKIYQLLPSRYSKKFGQERHLYQKNGEAIVNELHFIKENLEKFRWPLLPSEKKDKIYNASLQMITLTEQMIEKLPKGRGKKINYCGDINVENGDKIVAALNALRTYEEYIIDSFQIAPPHLCEEQFSTPTDRKKLPALRSFSSISLTPSPLFFPPTPSIVRNPLSPLTKPQDRKRRSSERKKGREGKHSYEDTPSLSLEEWHDLYWFLDKEAIDLTKIHSGLSTLGIVLVGTEESKIVYFVKNKTFIQKEGSDLTVEVKLSTQEMELLKRQGKENIVKAITSYHSLINLIDRINETAGFSIKKKSSPLKVSSLYAMDAEDQIKYSIDYGIEHAERRVDLFFLQLVLYYKSNKKMSIGKTDRQCGQGMRYPGQKTQGTDACHSSLLPSLIEEYLYTEATFSDSTAPSWSIENTIFAWSLNSTVELFVWFNYFDNHHLEHALRPIAREILNQVSRGEKTPIEGLSEFFEKMEIHLDHVKKPYQENERALKQSPPSFT